MSMARFAASQDNIATGTAAKVLIEVGAPSSGRFSIFEWWWDGMGVVAAATPILIELVRATASITSTGSLTPVPLHLGSPTSSAGTSEYGGTGAYPHGGTAGATVYRKRIPPSTGFHYPFPPGREIEVAASEFLWMKVTAAADVTCAFGFAWEE